MSEAYWKERAKRLEAALCEALEELGQLWENTLSSVSVITERGEREVSNDEDNRELKRLSDLIDKCDGALAPQDATPAGDQLRGILNDPERMQRITERAFDRQERYATTRDPADTATQAMAQIDEIQRNMDTPQPEPTDEREADNAHGRRPGGMTRIIECPDCYGSGYISDSIPEDNPPAPGMWPVCERCDGEGEIDIAPQDATPRATDDPWESGALGESEEHVRVCTDPSVYKAAEALQDVIDTPVIGKAWVDEATQEERDRLRRRATIHAVLATRMGRKHTSTSVQPELLLGLLNDADRLAALERGVRELADHFAGMPGKIDEEVAAEHLRALLNPPTSREADEESGDDHE